MNSRRGRWRPLHDAVWLLVAIATISMVITLHLGDSLTWFRSGPEAEVLDTNEGRGVLEHLTIQRSVNNINAGETDTVQNGIIPNRDLVGHGGLDIYESDIKQVDDIDDREDGGFIDVKGGVEIKNERLVPKNNQYEVDSERIDENSFNEAVVNFHKNDFRGKLPAKVPHSSYQNNEDGRKHDTSQGGSVDNSLKFPLTKETGYNNIDISRETDDFHSKDVEAALDGEYTMDKTRKNTKHLNDASVRTMFERLTQIEDALLPSQSDDIDILVKGSLSAVKHHLPLIESAFHKHKANVLFQSPDGSSSSTTPRSPTWRDNWSLVICLNSTDKGDDCVVTSVNRDWSNHQKVNVIPELKDVLVSPSLLCHTSNQKDQEKEPYGRWLGGDLPCKSQMGFEQLINANTFCENTIGLWTVTGRSTGVTGQFLPCRDEAFKSERFQERSKETVVVQLPKTIMTLNGSAPLVWQFEFLLTSLSPPRVYLHQNGLAWEGLQGTVSRRHQKNLSLHDLRQLITELKDEETSYLTLAKVETAVMELVKLLEQSASSSGRLCPRCFQLFETVVVFNTSFHPFLLEVASSQYSEHLSSLSDYLLEQNILEDLATTLISRERTAAYVLNGLLASGFTSVENGNLCTDNRDYCIQESEMIYLLDNRREQRALKNWIRLFPVPSCQEHRPMQSKESSAQGLTHRKANSDLEFLALKMENYFLCPRQNLTPDASYIPQDRRLNFVGMPSKNLLSYSNVPFLSETCDNDTTSLPYLSAILISPYIQLYPEFSPLTTEYQAYVDHRTILIQIQGVPKNCKTKSSLEDRYEHSRWSNFSIGVGENMAHLLVLDTEQSEPYILNTYKINIHRRKADHHLHKIPESDSLPQKVCSLKQDCSLPLSHNEPCGLQPYSKMSDWKVFIQLFKTLPQCSTDSVSGQWLVPCESCKDNTSCMWSNAIWQPEGCTEKRLSRDAMKDCFRGKKVLFIGDSTNRGILHYISERLNKTLQSWDKTHNIRVYTDLNEGRTMFGFAYYPQFWLPLRERPMFDKALSQLIKRTASFSDSQKFETVIVLGGVHWLAKHHIDMLVAALEREGLRGAKVVVKGLGAGFHQSVSGVHKLSLHDQVRLADQNKAVLSYAVRNGFSTVDTFRMTMARYKDFLQGKCACHFHKVSLIQPSIVSKLSSSGTQTQDHSTKYHVEGDINAVYSEMVINRICSPAGG